MKRRREARLRVALMAMAVLLGSCGPTPPRVSISVRLGSNAPPIGGLARLRLLVRECEKKEPTVAMNLAKTAPDGNEQLDAPVEPGKSFYVWVQAWQECNPPCVPLSSAQVSDCACVEDLPRAQVLTAEACSDWIKATEDQTELTLTLHPINAQRLFPPLPLRDCDVVP